MPNPSRRLGRGLDSLVSHLSDSADSAIAAALPKPQSVSSPSPDSRRGVTYLTVSTGQLSANPFQPRKEFDDSGLAALAESIRENGMIQPIIVRRQGNGFQIVAGERRWRAAQRAGLEEVPVVVRDVEDQEMLEFALVENIQREDLNPLDRAMAYRDFCRRFNVSSEELGRRIGEDRTTVANYMRILELPEAVRDHVARNLISMGHARCLAGIGGRTECIELADYAVSSGCSVRQLESMVRRAKSSEAAEARGGDDGRRTVSAAPKSALGVHIAELERIFEERIKTKVRIEPGRLKGSGRVLIEYYCPADFERIADIMGVRLPQ